MRFLTLYIVISFIFLSGGSGCRKDVEEFHPYPSTADFLESLLKEKIPPPSSGSVFKLPNLDKDVTLTTSQGTRITLIDTDKLFVDASGSAVTVSNCPDLTLHVTEILTKGEMVAQKVGTLPVKGIANTFYETLGILKIEVTCGGQPYQLAPGRTIKIQLPSNTLPLQDDLKLGYGSQNSSNGNFEGWNLSTEKIFPGFWATPFSNDQPGYEMHPSKLGWISALKSIIEPTSTFCVSLTPPYSAQNSLVYLVFKNSKSTLQLQAGSPNSTVYCSESVPVGFPVKVVVVSKIKDQYALGNRDTETGTNSNVTVSPVSSTEEQVLAVLKNL